MAGSKRGEASGSERVGCSQKGGRSGTPAETRLHPDAHALTLFRIVGDEGRAYTATTFPKNPWRGCEQIIRQACAVGFIVDQADSYGLIDVLAENGDIVQDFGVTQAGFRWIKRKLNLKVEQPEDEIGAAA